LDSTGVWVRVAFEHISTFHFTVRPTGRGKLAHRSPVASGHGVACTQFSGVSLDR
jgi:hypothetical protein